MLQFVLQFGLQYVLQSGLYVVLTRKSENVAVCAAGVVVCVAVCVTSNGSRGLDMVPPLSTPRDPFDATHTATHTTRPYKECNMILLCAAFYWYAP